MATLACRSAFSCTKSAVTACANDLGSRSAQSGAALSVMPASFGSSSARNGRLVVRAEEGKTENKGLQRKGILQGGRWLSATTRHIRIYVGYIDPVTMDMDQTQMDKLSILLDPDNEFLWTPETEKKVYDKFTELVDAHEGGDLTEYTLRLIGSDLEHYIRSMLLDGEISYNLDCRVLNFSMGKPRVGVEISNQ